MTRQLTQQARDLGFESINYDLIYGLPAQNLEKMRRAAEITMDLRPDRIALYSFCFCTVGLKKPTVYFTKDDLPAGEEKTSLV